MLAVIPRDGELRLLAKARFQPVITGFHGTLLQECRSRAPRRAAHE